MSQSAHSPRRRLPLRFSLRVLLVAVTVFGIGFPVWYRWSYEEQDRSASKTPGVMRIITWQRQWGGGRLKHGPERTYRNGDLILIQTFRRGMLHGPFESWRRNGGRETGQYADGKKDGVWRLIDPEGNVHLSATWRNDQLDGPYEMTPPSGKHHQLMFDRGRVVLADGEKVYDRLGELIADGALDSRTVSCLASQLHLECVDTPVKDVAAFVAMTGDLPVLIDPHHVNPDMRIDSDWKGLQLCSALAIIGSDHNFRCDYRYGVVWITSAEDVKDWRDPTEVADVEPPRDSPMRSKA